jgi:hypothetical protein
VTSETAARLQSLNIQWHTRERGYCLFVRENCAAFAQEREGALKLGSSGIMTDHGLAYLVWRQEQPFLAAHGGMENPANAEQLEAIQRFSEDLKRALGS